MHREIINMLESALAKIGRLDVTPIGEGHDGYKPFIDFDVRLYPSMNPCVKKQNHGLTPRRVIYNNPATIVYWMDGTKTIVKCENEIFDEEKGLAMCIAKKAMGNTGAYYKVFKKHLYPNTKSKSIIETLAIVATKLNNAAQVLQNNQKEESNDEN